MPLALTVLAERETKHADERISRGLGDMEVHRAQGLGLWCVTAQEAKSLN